MNSSQVNFKQSYPLFVALPILLVALALALFLYPTVDLPNGSQTVYRYAEQFRAGNGLVFNAGEHVLLVPAPLYILLLGVVTTLFPTVDVWTTIAIVFGLSLGVGALAIFWITQRAGLAVATVIALLYVLAWPLLFGAGTAYPIAAMFCLLALAFALNEHWQLSGTLLACATLCAPESLLWTLPLILTSASKGKAVRFTFSLVLPLIISVVALRVYYGSSLWDGLLLWKTSTDSGNGWLWMLPLPVLGLVLWVFSRKAAIATLNICAALIVAYLLVIAGILRVQTSASYALITGPALLLIVIGGRFTASSTSNEEERRTGTFSSVLWRVMRTVGFSLFVVIIIIGFFAAHPIVDQPAPIRFPPQARTIGIDALTYNMDVSPQQSLISFDGQLQPELKAIIERGDMQSALIRYAPDVLVIGDVGRLRARDLNSPGLARLGYHPSEQAGVYVRGNAIGNFMDTPITAAFGPDIMLTGAALDQTSLKSEQLLRVRLDWQFAQPANNDITIDLRLISGQGDQYILARTIDTYDASIFREGPYSTYHTLIVNDLAWDGPVTLQVGVEINGGVAARRPIAILNIETPKISQ